MSPRQAQWEYEERTISLHYRTIELNNLGKEGWELVQVNERQPGDMHLMVWLKRQIQAPGSGEVR